jgi:hypothetical protein
MRFSTYVCFCNASVYISLAHSHTPVFMRRVWRREATAYVPLNLCLLPLYTRMPYVSEAHTRMPYAYDAYTRTTARTHTTPYASDAYTRMPYASDAYVTHTHLCRRRIWSRSYPLHGRHARPLLPLSL